MQLEESAGAAFLRLDGTVWTTDKDGNVPGLLAAEITAKAGRDPGEIYRGLAAEFGESAYDRIDSPSTPEQKKLLADNPSANINAGVLYRATISIPSQVPVGSYTAETFLIDRGRVLAAATREIQIDKSGFERFVALAARRHAFLYGLISVILSLGLGYAAGVMFRRRF